jgi:hypothetical protein
MADNLTPIHVPTVLKFLYPQTPRALTARSGLYAHSLPHSVITLCVTSADRAHVQHRMQWHSCQHCTAFWRSQVKVCVRTPAILRAVVICLSQPMQIPGCYIRLRQFRSLPYPSHSLLVILLLYGATVQLRPRPPHC